MRLGFASPVVPHALRVDYAHEYVFCARNRTTNFRETRARSRIALLDSVAVDRLTVSIRLLRERWSTVATRLVIWRIGRDKCVRWRRRRAGRSLRADGCCYSSA